MRSNNTNPVLSPALVQLNVAERVPATPKKWADTILVPNHQKSIVAVPAGTRQVGAPNKCAVPAHTSRTPKHVADLEF